MFRSSINKTDKGFTLVELIIVITVMGIMSSILFGALDDLYLSNTRSLAITTQTSYTRAVLRVIQDDLASSSEFLAANTVADPTGSNGGGANWSFVGNDANTSHRVLIARTHATTKSSDDPTRSLVYLKDSGGVCDTANIANNPTLDNNLVYYISNSILYRRTIVADTTASPRCPGYDPAQKQSCAPGVTNSKCSATDAVLLRNVTALTVSYYNVPSSTTALNVYSNPSLLNSSVTTIAIGVTTTQTINGKPSTVTSNLRISHAY